MWLKGVNYREVIHNLTGYRFGRMKIYNVGINQDLVHGYGTEGRNRTGTSVRKPDFESGASTSSATPAHVQRALYRKKLAVNSWQSAVNAKMPAMLMQERLF